ncbi:hypothetical protein D0C36_20350 [Mucilaginibacter conchicola]|uniref:Uncharacterized protein n=2 Tax=Mucilaginibacter conchicola TaxID=2303333 RepID=A0A372NQS4_9SPHI|nr:hypothetical protein D0C36_20350 [Mucilaginibacter conchicola]
MYTFDHLSDTEQQEFLKCPAYLPLLAANRHGFAGDKELVAAEPFDHLETFAPRPLLAELYEQAKRVYQPNLEKLDNQLPKGKFERDVAIRSELKKISGLLLKFDAAFAALMHQNMNAFKGHVSAAHEDNLDDFYSPCPARGSPKDQIKSAFRSRTLHSRCQNPVYVSDSNSLANNSLDRSATSHHRSNHTII